MSRQWAIIIKKINSGNILARLRDYYVQISGNPIAVLWSTRREAAVITRLMH